LGHQQQEGIEMADSRSTSDLRTEAEQALLEEIKAKAPKQGSASGLASLAYAYSLVVGAAPGKLPGGPPTVINQ
jgi:hypothetical protein